MSIRIGTPVFPRPSGPIAVTLIDDCDPPSWLMLSGIALSVSVSASPDGPVSGGGVESLTVQPAAARSASATAARRKNVDDMVLLIPEVSELDLNLSGRLHLVAGAIDPVERHLREDRQDVRAHFQLHERGLLLRDVANELEPDGQRAARR